MPGGAAENIPHVAWTDHRILRPPDATPKPATDYTQLVPIFSPNVTTRNLALALFSAVMDGHTEDGAQAENLAAIDCMQGDRAAVRATLEAALRFSPGSHELQRRFAQIGACRVDNASASPRE